MGVFLQPDPIGFKGDAANLYRFCTNNAVNRTDPDGLTPQPDPPQKIMEDNMWESARHFDSANTSHGTFPQAGMNMNSGKIVLELIPAGDRHISLKEVKKQDGSKALGLTESDFKVRDPEKQPDGGWKVTGVYTLNVKYADGTGSKAGPKSLNHTYNEEWRHAVPFDRWFARAQVTVREMNKAFHFVSPWRARDALDAQLRPGYDRAYRDSLSIHRDGSQHNSPYKYEE